MMVIVKMMIISTTIVRKKDYIPKSNAAFNSWQLNFVQKVNLYISGWNLSPDATMLWTTLTTGPTSKKVVFDQIWAIVSTKQFTHAQEQKLKNARFDYVSGDKNNPSDISIRSFVNRFLRYNPLVTSDQKNDLGLTVPDQVKTPTSDINARLSGIELAGAVKATKHLIITSEIKTPGKKSKELEDGVLEIEVYMSIVDNGKDLNPPADDTYVYAGQAKRGLYTEEFTEAQMGSRAWFKARKIIKGKQKTFGHFCAPWSGVIS